MQHGRRQEGGGVVRGMMYDAVHVNVYLPAKKVEIYKPCWSYHARAF
jgi:hypothetical protein